MPYNEQIANRVRKSLALFPESFTEKKMFGGLSFLYYGKMTIGIVKDEFLVRVIQDKMESCLKMEYVRPMDFTKRAMKEFVFVTQEGFKTEEALLKWIEIGLEHAKSKL